MNEVKVHDVVQINENHKWCGAFVYVTEIKKFGIQGFIYVPNEGQAFVRLSKDEYEIIGEAVMKANLD